MICPKCNAENPDSATFCGLCLARFGPEPTAESTPSRPAHRFPQRSAGMWWLAGAGVLVFSAILIGVLALKGVLDPSDFSAQYTVKEYSVTFRPEPVELPAGVEEGNSSAVTTTMRITYDIGAVPKNGGFKFVGHNDITAVSVTDGDGKPLQFEIDSPGETRITWHFPMQRMSTQTVVVRFTSHADALLRAPDGSVKYEAT